MYNFLIFKTYFHLIIYLIVEKDKLLMDTLKYFDFINNNGVTLYNKHNIK